MSGSGERRVTQAPRTFGPEELAQLPREESRRLCHVLLLAEGAVVSGFTATGDFDEFVVGHPSLWRRRESVVRVFYRALTSRDLEDLHELQQYADYAEALAVTTVGVSDDLRGGHAQVIGPSRLIELIVNTALVRWDNERPSADADRLEFFSALEADNVLLDPIGISWLPHLALNELPTALLDQGVSPQDLFERKAFRLLTACFRFGGIRYGESRRGQRLPDAQIDFPGNSLLSALLDCKAASNGFRLRADDMLRFEEYWETLHEQVASLGNELRYFLVLSSFFAGEAGGRHPFYGRRDELLERTGLELVYLEASDLAWAAAEVEAAELKPASRESIDWEFIFSPGVVTTDVWRAALAQVRT